MGMWHVISGASGALVLASLAGAQVRVVQWNLAGLRGDPGAIATTIDYLDQDDRPGFAGDVSILTVQEADTATYNHLLSTLGPEWSAATYTNSNEDNYGGAQACFYHAERVTEIPEGHDDTFTEAGRRADRWQFSLNGYDNPPVTFYVYSAHLKAGNNSSAADDRDVGAGRIVANMTEVADASRVIVTGDMNFYGNDEAGYQTLLAGGLMDPWGTGDWVGSSHAIKHTQSPRTTQADGLANGGLDDRFDLQLYTPTMSGTAGMCYIQNSIRSVGNDGNHYNTAINDGNNTYWPANVPASNNLADAIHDASDHLPVAADYRLPPVLNASWADCDLGTVIEGASIDCVIDLANVVSGTNQTSAALPWSMSGTGVLSENDYIGNLSPGEAWQGEVLIDTAAIGPVADDLTVTSSDETTQHAPFTATMTGHILRHANPSFVADADNNFYVHFVEADANSGVIAMPIQFWNYQWDADQARMDIDDVSEVDAPLAFLGGSWNNVGPFAVTMPFEIDTTGLAPGNYVRPVTITVSDEDLPGEASTSLIVTFNIDIHEQAPECQGDVSGDGVTDVTDLLLMLDGYGSSDPVLDIVPDGIVDINDMLAMLGDFGCS